MTKRGSIPLIAVMMIVGSSCVPLPRWCYLAVTRVEPLTGAEGFSVSDVSRAKFVAAEVAKKIGMVTRDDDPKTLETEQWLSANEKPPREYLISYYGKMSQGLPIELRVEISQDRRALYFSVSDPEEGAGRPVVARIRSLMMANVEAAYPDASIVHEASTRGPFFDHP